MQPYFVWRGKDSRAMGVIVSSYPPIIRPVERAVQQTIPGRPGTLTVTQGDDVYDAYVKSFVIGLRPGVDAQAVIGWLRGSGEMVFGNEPGYRYFGRILAAVQFDKVGAWSLKSGAVQFFAQPYKGRSPKEPDVTVTSSTTSILNPGDVASRPVITVGSAGTLSLAIGDTSLTVTSAPSGLVIDCDAGVMLSGGALWTGSWEGEFLRIPPGAAAVSLTGPSCALAPNWRWI